MGRKRLLTMLGVTTLAMGTLTTPAAALTAPSVTQGATDTPAADPEVTVPIPGVGSVTVAGDADPGGPAAHAAVVADAQQGDLGLDADPSVTVTVSPDGPTVDAEGGASLLGESVDLDEVAAPIEDVVGTGDGAQPAEQPAMPGSEPPRPPARGGQVGGLPTGTSPDASPARRSVVMRAPVDDVAETASPRSVLTPQPVPATVPPASGAVAAPQLPIAPADVPALLRALTALLVAGAIGTWSLVRRELS